MNYHDAVRYLNGLARFGWRLGLDRMEALCDRLNHPEQSFRAIHVAGTNGKGSTATYLANILTAAGIRTGLYTSPHIYSGLERIVINGEQIREEDVCRQLAMLLPHMEPVQRAHGPVTEFEAWTMIMFLHFREAKVGAAVVEAGLGGRWDSTNVLPPGLAVLTNVSLDHTDRLGSTVAEIARDKAGIIKPGGTLLAGALTPEAWNEVEAEVHLRGAQLFGLFGEGEAPRPSAMPLHWAPGRGGHFTVEMDGETRSFAYAGPRYGARNAALASAAALLLNKTGLAVPEQAFEQGLRKRIPGRFEVVRHSPEVILDGAHNPAAAAVLAAELARRTVESTQPDDEGIPRHTPSDLRLVFGSSTGHDGEACLRVLAPLAKEVILTRANNQRSRDPLELARCVAELEVPYDVIPNVAAAVETAIRRSGPHDRVCVTGSFFVLGEART